MLFLGGFWLLFVLADYFKLIALVLYSFWLPQIYHSARTNTKNPVPLSVAAMSTLTRLAPLLYFLANPDNFLHCERDLSYCMLLVGWCVAQVALLHAQQRFGPRFFVPARFLPPGYNYWRPLDADREYECVICMDSVEAAQRYMITPCNHAFHQPCLEQWMEVKMQCPVCRAVLPDV
jgi:hypothetical protein